jgi:hypothetical protein
MSISKKFLLVLNFALIKLKYPDSEYPNEMIKITSAGLWEIKPNNNAIRRITTKG